MSNTSTPNRGGKRSPRAHRTHTPEDRREQYEREAEALITLCEIEYGDYIEGADIGDVKDRPIMKGIARHMKKLFDRADFLLPLTIRRFYVELRLWGDMVAAAEAQGKLLVKDEGEKE